MHDVTAQKNTQKICQPRKGRTVTTYRVGKTTTEYCQLIFSKRLRYKHIYTHIYYKYPYQHISKVFQLSPHHIKHDKTMTYHMISTLCLERTNAGLSTTYDL